MVSLTAVVRARAGEAAALRRALEEVVAAVRESEPDTVGYFVLQDAGDPCRFTTFERYRDQAALDRHNGSAAVARFFAIAGPLLAEKPLLVSGAEVAAKE